MDYLRAKILLDEARRRGLLPYPSVDEYCKSFSYQPYDWQKKIIATERDMLVNCSRQSGKSLTASKKAHYATYYKPEQTGLIISPTLRQSGELFRKVRHFLRRRHVKLIEDNALSCTMENESRIIALPGNEETVRSFTPNFIIVDEAARVSDDLFSAITPMLAATNGYMMMLSTPFGKMNRFANEWFNGGDDWERIEVPATQVPHISPSFLEKERRRLGDWWFNQEYMCQFMDSTDSIFSFEAIMNSFTDDVEPIFSLRDVDDESIQHDEEVEELCFTLA